MNSAGKSDIFLPRLLFICFGIYLSWYSKVHQIGFTYLVIREFCKKLEILDNFFNKWST